MFQLFKKIDLKIDLKFWAQCKQLIILWNGIVDLAISHSAKKKHTCRSEIRQDNLKSCLMVEKDSG